MSSEKYDLINAKLKSFEDEKSEQERIEEDSFTLMANYLSEIEKFQKSKNIKRKDLAKRIGTSASYLTQVFRGDKPLNFATIAKIKRTLGLVFVVRAYPKDSFKGFNVYSNVQPNHCELSFSYEANYSYNGLMAVKDTVGGNFGTVTKLKKANQ